MYNFFVGCDMSKNFFDLSFTVCGEPHYLGQFSNNIGGFKQMMAQLKTKTNFSLSSWIICFENTGVYSKQFLNWLFEQKISCLEENPIQIKRSLGLKRGKSDKIDSKKICRYVFEKRDRIVVTLPVKQLIFSIKCCLSRRNLLLKHRQALTVSVKEQRLIMHQKEWEKLQADNQELITLYNRQITTLETEIKQLIKSQKNIHTNYKLLLSITGIGPIISAVMIVATDNFTRFKNSRKLACYIGVAPFPNSSGIYQGRKSVSNLANKKIKSLMSQAAITAKIHDPHIKAYFKRKYEEGKPKGLIYNAIKNKLIHRVFAVIKRQSPYVKMMH